MRSPHLQTAGMSTVQLPPTIWAADSTGSPPHSILTRMPMDPEPKIMLLHSWAVPETRIVSVDVLLLGPVIPFTSVMVTSQGIGILLYDHWREQFNGLMLLLI
jgi:hypothetical protein